jgi:hypothetical protein
VARETATAESEFHAVKAKVGELEDATKAHRNGGGAKAHPLIAVESAKTDAALEAMNKRLDSLERGQNRILRELRRRPAPPGAP